MEVEFTPCLVFWSGNCSSIPIQFQGVQAILVPAWHPGKVSQVVVSRVAGLKAGLFESRKSISSPQIYINPN